jgi:hypothetical protein
MEITVIIGKNEDVKKEYLDAFDGITFYNPENNTFPLTCISNMKEYIDKNKQENICISTNSPYIPVMLNNMIMKKLNSDPNYVRYDFKCFWINEDGSIIDMINHETGLIHDNELDSASNELIDEFRNEMRIYRKNKRK